MAGIYDENSKTLPEKFPLKSDLRALQSVRFRFAIHSNLKGECQAILGHSGEGPFGRLLRSRLVSTISFTGVARMGYSLLGNNVLKDHSHPTFFDQVRESAPFRRLYQ
jgi:hypothetical protein